MISLGQFNLNQNVFTQGLGGLLAILAIIYIGIHTYFFARSVNTPFVNIQSYIKDFEKYENEEEGDPRWIYIKTMTEKILPQHAKYNKQAGRKLNLITRFYFIFAALLISYLM